MSLDKHKGCLVGLAIGDAMGAPFEFWQAEAARAYLADNDLVFREFEYKGKTLPKGFYTDDTALMICTAESLAEAGHDTGDQFRRYRKWYLEGYATPAGDMAHGVGQRTMRALMHETPRQVDRADNTQAGGNGPLTRCLPYALYCHGDYQTMKSRTFESVYLTYDYEVTAWTSAVLNALASLIIAGVAKRDLLKRVLGIFGSSVPEGVRAALLTDFQGLSATDLPVSGYAPDTLRIALWSFLTEDDFKAGLKKVIALGGDTDTFAAVAGALHGAYLGYDNLPEEYREQVINEKWINELAEKLIHIK